MGCGLCFLTHTYTPWLAPASGTWAGRDGGCAGGHMVLRSWETAPMPQVKHRVLVLKGWSALCPPGGGEVPAFGSGLPSDLPGRGVLPPSQQRNSHAGGKGGAPCESEGEGSGALGWDTLRRLLVCRHLGSSSSWSSQSLFQEPLSSAPPTPRLGLHSVGSLSPSCLQPRGAATSLVSAVSFSPLSWGGGWVGGGGGSLL